MMTHPAINDKPSDAPGVTPPRWLFLAWLAALMGLAIFVRVRGAGEYYLSADEAVIRNMAAGSGFNDVWQFSHYEAPAPFANLLRHYWMQVADNPGFLRLLSLVFGLALIPLYYVIGRRLAGTLAGMACASLIAFSHGCIIQSTIVRNYSIFSFFLSLGFYHYLRWRDRQSGSALLGYALCNCLAVLCNISTLFTMACIAPLEVLRLWKMAAPWRIHLLWALANAAIFITGAVIYILWLPLLTPLKSYFLEFTMPPGSMLFAGTHYPVAVAGYLLPGRLFTLLLLSCILPFALALPQNTHPSGIRFIYALTALAMLLGTVLLLTNLYPYPGTRRSLWALPFVTVAAGLMIAQSCRCFLPSTARAHVTAAIAFMAFGFVFYRPQERFNDGTEYALTWAAWQEASRVLDTLTASDLIVTERDDGALLANLYRPLGQDAFNGATMVKIAPYHDLSILYNPYYPRNYSTAVFLANLSEARDKGLLNGIRRIVFFNTAWSRSPLIDLMLCPQLEKTIWTFPTMPKGSPLTRLDIYSHYLSITIISRRSLLDDVLSPVGKAHGCLDAAHDMVPGFMPISTRSTENRADGGN